MSFKRRQWQVALVVLLCATLGCVEGLGEIEAGPDGALEMAAVVSVVDGDTIYVSIGGDELPVRYIGIDAPEEGRSGDPPEWLSAEATELNRQLVEGQEVRLEKDVSDTDRYGRLLRYVFLDDGTFVNGEMVRLGLAEAKSYPPDVGRQDELDRLEREALKAGRGIWGPRPTASQ